MQKLNKTDETQRQAALNLLRRLPPQDLGKNLGDFAKIAPHLEKTLLPYISKPSKLKLDTETNRYFIACEYNLEGNTHRSPWSSKYIPAPPGGAAEEEKLFRPGLRLRQIEETYNEVFDAYKTVYYEGGVSSVYVWDLDEGFAAAFVIQKEIKQSRGIEKGIWDITHIVEVKESPNQSFSEYKLYTTMILHIEIAPSKDATKKAATSASAGETEIGGYLTRQAEDKRKKAGEETHLLHIGRMIEETENSIRQGLDTFYQSKHREVISYLRYLDTDALFKKPGDEAKKTVEQPKPGSKVHLMSPGGVEDVRDLNGGVRARKASKNPS